jgi:hypothetical protein
MTFLHVTWAAAIIWFAAPVAWNGCSASEGGRPRSAPDPQTLLNYVCGIHAVVEHFKPDGARTSAMQ